MQRIQDRLKSSLDAAVNEKQQLERIRLVLGDQIEDLNVENQKLQSANNELQKQRDHLEDEKEDLFKDKERQLKEKERWLANETATLNISN